MGEGIVFPRTSVSGSVRLEVAHADNDRTLDVRLTKKVIPAVARSGLQGDPRIVLRSASSDWLEVRVESAAGRRICGRPVRGRESPANLDGRSARVSPTGAGAGTATAFPLATRPPVSPPSGLASHRFG